jgi:lipopolysaccharide transport system permease protein
VSFQPATLLFPLGIGLTIVLGTAIGLLLTPLGVLYHDVPRAIGFTTAALFFLTPIVYPVPTSAWPALLIQLNPVTPILVTSRNWLTTGSMEVSAGFFGVSVLALAGLLVGWILYRVSMPHLIARISA